MRQVPDAGRDPHVRGLGGGRDGDTLDDDTHDDDGTGAAGSGEIATVGSPAIAVVVGEMDDLRAGLAKRDGLGLFVDVYRTVTALVGVRVTDGTFADPEFVEDLDVRFAEIFLDVPRDLAAGRPVSKAWAPLVERRDAAHVLSIQFALAGMNAHINHDLALAVVRTCAARGVEPESGTIRADFEKVNEVLAEVVRPIRQQFLDRELVRRAGAASPVLDAVSNFSIDKARDAAWVSALALWHLRHIPPLAARVADTLASTVGLVGRQLLVVDVSGG